MNKNKTIIGIILSGILAVGAQARPNDSRKSDSRNSRSQAPLVQTQKKGKVQSYSRGHSKGYGRTYNSRSVRPVARLPRNSKRVSFRGVTFYVSNGVCYQPARGGYVSVRRPW